MQMQPTACASSRRGLALLFVSLLLAACGGGGGGGNGGTSAGNNADLINLSLLTGNLDQIFQPNQTSYTATVRFLTASLEVIATADDAGATIRIDGTTVASGAPGRVHLATGRNAVTIEVTAENGSTTRTYDLEITRRTADEFAQQAYVKASNTQAYDHFGFSVALDGDTLAVGAYDEDSSATGEGDNGAADSGAVYVFARDDDGVWSQQAYVKASNTDAGDQFGLSVALDGDTLAVGAYEEDGGATGVNGDDTLDNVDRAGAVYVYTRDGAGTWSQQAYVKASNPDAGDLFGRTVALDGDTLAVGAHAEDSNATGVSSDGTGEGDNSAADSGAVYVFTRDNNGVWSQQVYVKASNTEAGDRFGNSVTLDGNTLAVGARNEDGDGTSEADNSADDAGAVYVYTRDDVGSWSQQAYLKASNTDEGDLFGGDVALDGDTLVVGASDEDSSATGTSSDGTGEHDNSASDAGAVYVFTRDSDGVWSQQAYLKASNTDEFDSFGYRVVLDHDILVVGTYAEDSNATGVNGNEMLNDADYAGAIYVYARDGDGMWSQQAYVKASNTDKGDEFGTGVGIDGDTLVVGAPHESGNTTGVSIDGSGEHDDRAPESGAVYIRR